MKKKRTKLKTIKVGNLTFMDGVEWNLDKFLWKKQKKMLTEPMTLLHVGRKAPKGFRETGGMHLGKGIWMLTIEPITKPCKNHSTLQAGTMPIGKPLAQKSR